MQTSPPNSKLSLFGMAIDRVTLGEAMSQLLDRCAAPSDGRCHYVVTPNVDHVVMHHTRADLRAAYQSAAMVLADGAPLIAASRLLGKPLPERVAGSDLTPAVLRAAGTGGRPPLRVFLLGAGPGIAEVAAEKIVRRNQRVEVVGTYCPPLGFEKNAGENEAILAAIASAKPDLLIIGLGAPKQELWISRFHERIDAKVALCVGATIDFLAGHKQ
ncbi:MAG: WecB/TagA/CpsF family glycosyltransferase, partial [Planctomycetota bacterium]